MLNTLLNVIYLVYTYDPNGRINYILWLKRPVVAAVRTRMTSYVNVSHSSIDCKYIEYL